MSTEEFKAKYPDVFVIESEGIYELKPYKTTQFAIDQNHIKFTHFIDKIANAIFLYNRNIPYSTAKAMAKSGVIRNMLDWEIQLNRNEREGNNNKKGTKCTP